MEGSRDLEKLAKKSKQLRKIVEEIFQYVILSSLGIFTKLQYRVKFRTYLLFTAFSSIRLRLSFASDFNSSS